MPLAMPRQLVESTAASGDDARRSWLERLPSLVESVRARWSLELDEPFQPGGVTAWVAPARQGDERDLVLKVAWRHSEAEHEPDGLRLWDGEGAVRLHDAARLDNTVALLLERCVPGVPLTSLPEPEQDGVIASLLHQLWQASPRGEPFRPLEDLCSAWADAFERRGPPPGLDPGLAREGINLFRSLPASTERRVLLCTDLHAGNVLSARRAPWLVIDPKPYVGDPAFDAIQHLLNCQRLYTDPRGLARHIADELEVDADRVLLWLFARSVQGSNSFPELGAIARQVAP